jgi:hypothetical protein
MQPVMVTAYSKLRAVVFEFAEGRGGHKVRQFLGHPGEEGWRCKLVCDDFSGYTKPVSSCA